MHDRPMNQDTQELKLEAPQWVLSSHYRMTAQSPDKHSNTSTVHENNFPNPGQHSTLAKRPQQKAPASHHQARLLGLLGLAAVHRQLS
jgi:hypothetical protein